MVENRANFFFARDKMKAVKNLLEHFRAASVKGVMISARLMLALVLPMLWLGAAADARAHTLTAFESRPATAVIAASGKLKASPYLAVQLRASRWLRRFPSAPPPLDPHFGVGSTSSRSLSISRDLPGRPDSEATLCLALGWQFRWRTALSPRAPSLVS